MSKLVAMIVGLVLGCGCAEQLPHTYESCNVAADCKRIACMLAECIDNECVRRNNIDGMLCDYRDATGVCADGACISLADAPVIDGLPEMTCAQDSDCFVRQCTNSICSYGHCHHVEYADGSMCIDTVNDVTFFGRCKDGACE